MPNTLKFRCIQTNTKLQNAQVAPDRHERQPITTIEFQIVPGDDANSWVRNGAGNNQPNGGSRNFAIATTDPIASIAFRVGRDYRFSIEDWDDGTGEDEQEEGDAEPSRSYLPEFIPRPMARAERRRQAFERIVDANGVFGSGTISSETTWLNDMLRGIEVDDIRARTMAVADDFHAHRIDYDAAIQRFQDLKANIYEFHRSPEGDEKITRLIDANFANLIG